MEVLAIVRAHITALGGNAMVAFFMTKCVLLHSPHKNQVRIIFLTFSKFDWWNIAKGKLYFRVSV